MNRHRRWRWHPRRWHIILGTALGCGMLYVELWLVLALWGR